MTRGFFKGMRARGSGQRHAQHNHTTILFPQTRQAHDAKGGCRQHAQIETCVAARNTLKSMKAESRQPNALKGGTPPTNTLHEDAGMQQLSSEHYEVRVSASGFACPRPLNALIALQTRIRPLRPATNATIAQTSLIHACCHPRMQFWVCPGARAAQYRMIRINFKLQASLGNSLRPYRLHTLSKCASAAARAAFPDLNS